MDPETLMGHRISCYDEGSVFTVYYLDGDTLLRGARMGPDPYSGLGEECKGLPEDNTGMPISFMTLPPDCQRFVIQDLL